MRSDLAISLGFSFPSHWTIFYGMTLNELEGRRLWPDVGIYGSESSLALNKIRKESSTSGFHMMQRPLRSFRRTHENQLGVSHLQLGLT